MILFAQESANAVGSMSEGVTGLTLGGWIFISIAWTGVLSLLIFCYRRIWQKAAERKQQARFQATSNDNDETK